MIIIACSVVPPTYLSFIINHSDFSEVYAQFYTPRESGFLATREEPINEESNKYANEFLVLQQDATLGRSKGDIIHIPYRSAFRPPHPTDTHNGRSDCCKGQFAP